MQECKHLDIETAYTVNGSELEHIISQLQSKHKFRILNTTNQIGSKDYEILIEYKATTFKTSFCLYCVNDTFFSKSACMECETCLGMQYYEFDFKKECEILSRNVSFHTNFEKLSKACSVLTPVKTSIEDHIMEIINDHAEYSYNKAMEENEKDAAKLNRIALARKICGL